MDVTQIYVTAAGGLFFVFLLVNFLPRTVRFWRTISLLTSKHLTYPYLVHRHRFVGPWTRSGVLLQLIYIALNVFCLAFRVPTLSKAGLRAGNLSLANMIPLFAGAHLSFLADLLGFPLNTVRRVHRSAGLMAVALLLFHALVLVSDRTSFSLKVPEHLYGLIVRHPSPLAFTLTPPRQDRPSVFSCSSHIPSCAGPRTKSFSERTKHWPRCPHTPVGVTCHPIRCSLACISTSLPRCSSRRRSPNAAAFYGETGPCDVVSPGLL